MGFVKVADGVVFADKKMEEAFEFISAIVRKFNRGRARIFLIVVLFWVILYSLILFFIYDNY